MINIVKKILYYYLNNKVINKNDLVQPDSPLLKEKGTVFVTIYNKGNIVGCCGNIIDIENSILDELIKNTVLGIQDPRFKSNKLTTKDINNIKIRIDKIDKKILMYKNITNDEKIKGVKNVLEDLNPKTDGVLVMKKDYEKLVVILPNISPSIKEGKDFFDIISNKLNEKFNPNNYYIYYFNTKITAG